MECPRCDRSFYYYSDMMEHIIAWNHWEYECQYCTYGSMDSGTVGEHQSNCCYAPRFECETCTGRFMTQRDCDNHMKAVSHWNLQTYCQACNRHFSNENNLQQHLRSSIHQGRNVPCPFCKTRFTTPSGMSHHLETGSCPSAQGLNRETIFNIVRQRDRSGVITEKLLEWNSDPETVATDRTWNGRGYECYMCHKEFGKLNSLNQHLASPVHQRKLYHCPGNCGTKFVSLAGLFNHLESESCNYMRFDNVKTSINGFFNPSRAITFH